MDEATRDKMGSQAIALAKACGYESTGTVEFLMDKNKDFYFLEMNTRLQVEHPITEEITGIDLVEQQILIAAGHPLSFKQSDVKINGHSAEYRVYAEDPSRKFLPSIGFLKKYKEPREHEHIRIDTGVQEGSEISMYYDPMISKLITWGKNRKECLDLLYKAMDEYVIRGVTHNIGFGQSILKNKAFADGQYTTAFIPTYYPTGFNGDPLDDADNFHIALGAHYIRNLYNNIGKNTNHQNKVHYVTIQEKDFRIEDKGNENYEVTDVASGKSSTINAKDINLEYGSLLRYNQDGNGKLLQFLEAQENLYFNFYYKGNTIKSIVYDEAQYRLKKHMAPPKKVDHAKSVISPMPGSIVSVSVEPDQTVAEGQELLVVEAMKMQNIIKSEIEGKIKKVNVKPGQSVAVDELLIEFH